MSVRRQHVRLRTRPRRSRMRRRAPGGILRRRAARGVRRRGAPREAPRGPPRRREGGRGSGGEAEGPGRRSVSSWTASSSSRRGSGARETAGGAVDADTVFRIASMTKSFTALAILRLRDEGGSRSTTPSSKWVPELAGMPKATKDSPEITLRHLLTHSEGFPEDNPWGDRQLAQTTRSSPRWRARGSRSRPPPASPSSTQTRASRSSGASSRTCRRCVTATTVDALILRPLGMTSTYWEASAVPPGRLAKGYRRDGEALAEEPILADGAFGSMGGLFSTVRDLARYTAYFLSAWPPRDDADAGPVARASLREMQQVARFYQATARRTAPDAPLHLAAGGYAYGLGARATCRFRHVVSHGGGLPGYGSLMLWLPEHGVAVVALANLTYTKWGDPFVHALDALAATGALQPRVPQPSPALRAAQASVDALYDRWDDAAFDALAAENLVLDSAAGEAPVRFRRAPDEARRLPPGDARGRERAPRGLDARVRHGRDHPQDHARADAPAEGPAPRGGVRPRARARGALQALNPLSLPAASDPSSPRRGRGRAGEPPAAPPSPRRRGPTFRRCWRGASARPPTSGCRASAASRDRP